MAIHLFSNSDRTNVMEEFCEESLFRFLFQAHRIKCIDNSEIWPVDIWDEAKQMAKKILSSKYPEIQFDQVVQNWKEGTDKIASSHKGYNTWMGIYYEIEMNIDVRRYFIHQVISSLYYIIVYTLYFNDDNKFRSLRLNQDLIPYSNDLAEALREEVVAYDYDYPQGTKVEQLKVVEDKTPDILQPLSIEVAHDKVRLEVFCCLLKSAGVNFDDYGVKAECARLANYILKTPLQTCKNFMSLRDLNTDEHKEEVKQVNDQLEKIGIKWTLND